jgi:hypothetical protein
MKRGRAGVSVRVGVLVVALAAGMVGATPTSGAGAGDGPAVPAWLRYERPATYGAAETEIRVPCGTACSCGAPCSGRR